MADLVKVNVSRTSTELKPRLYPMTIAEEQLVFGRVNIAMEDENRIKSQDFSIWRRKSFGCYAPVSILIPKRKNRTKK